MWNERKVMDKVTSYVLQSGGPVYAGFGMAVLHRVLNYVTGVTAIIPVAVTSGGVGYIYATAMNQDMIGGVAKGLVGGIGGDMAARIVL